MWWFVICTKLAGCTVIALGAWLFMDSTKGHLFNLFIANTTPHETIHSIAVTLFSFGIILVIIGFYGCRAAFQESRCMLFIVSFNPL